MKYKVTSLLIFLFLLSSCGGFSEAGKVLRNEKITNTDEFLIKKREPLSLPPDFDKLPEPGSIKNKNKKEKKISEIINIEEESSSSNKSTTVEESILEKIRK